MLRRSLALLLSLLALVTPAAGAVTARVKDVTMVAGSRDNQLVGYGLVAGLASDGDKNPTYTLQTIANLLQRYNITVPAATLSAKNVAVVMVTADIPAFKKPGSRIDITISSLGDAKTLQGGVLLQTPLVGVDGQVYALAQGPLSLGGISGGTDGAGGASVQKNHPTTAQIVGGAIVEKEIPTELMLDNSIALMLREPDFTSAARLAGVVNQAFPATAQAIDSTTVRIRVPEPYAETLVDFISRVEALEVQVDAPARIIINERTGTIVASSRISIASCAVSHGNLTITVASTLDVSQPSPLSQTGQTVVTPSTQTAVNEEKASLVTLPEMPTIEKVASALNALGVTPRDMMSIFQAMKQAGALQAELLLR